MTEYVNLARLQEAQYAAAFELYNTERHDEMVGILEAMAADAHLTLWFRMQVHNLLASALTVPWQALEHLERAERAYAEIMRRWPPGTQGQERLHNELLPMFATDMRERREELEAAMEADSSGDESVEHEKEPATNLAPLTPTLSAMAMDVEQPAVQESLHASTATANDFADRSSSLPSRAQSPTATVATSPVASPLAARHILNPVTPRARRNAGPRFNLPLLPSTRQSGGSGHGNASPRRRRLSDDEFSPGLGSPSKRRTH